jgi:N-hydroxyarylamine O-acetyltransferase
VTTLLSSYLDRLHLEHEPPSVPALHRLVAAQTRHVPYETVWLYLGDRRGISPRESLRHVVTERRGGYCYQLNGAFHWLLRSLGYNAVLHRSSVHGPEAPTPMQRLNHAGLVVHDLPDDTNPGGRWFADAGLGDGPSAAIPVIDGAHYEAPFRWRIAPAEHTPFEFEVRHDPSGSFDRVGIGAPVTSMHPYVARHRWLSTSPNSGFRRAVVVQRREGPGIVTLRGLLFTRARRTTRDESTVEDASTWFTLLGDEFGITLDGTPRSTLQRFWRHVSTQHESWLAEQQRAGA